MNKCLLQGCNKEARIKFCSNRHKDRYHNCKNPRGKFEHLSDFSDDHEDDDHIFSIEGLGQD